MNNIILHIPHSSTLIPYKDGYLVNDTIINEEILKLTDWYTDDLFDLADTITIRADFSRIFCDPERFVDDSEELMAKYGMGVLYIKTDDGRELRKVSKKLRDRILHDFYYPHHNKLNQAVNAQLKKHITTTIIDCHSFPNIPFNCSENKDHNRPDFNIGTDQFHTPQKLIDISIDFFNKEGYSLGIDWPYSGSIVSNEHYLKNKNVQTIMLEINRKLYLEESTNKKSTNYSKIKRVAKEFLKAIIDKN